MNRLTVTCLALLLTACAATLADGLVLPRSESKREAHALVASSTTSIQQGQPRQQVLASLLSIAEAHDTDPETAIGSVRAIFHLVQDNDLTVRYLFQIMESTRAGSAAYSTACELVVLVADESTASDLLERAKEVWRSGSMDDGFRALTLLGHQPFREWAESILSTLDNSDPRRAHLRRQVEFLRAMTNPSRLLDLISALETEFDKRDLVLQALRGGLGRKAIRESVMGYLLQKEETEFTMADYALLIECDTAGILADSDGLLAPVVKARALRDALTSDEGVFPSWATLVAVKRAEFYRIPAVKSETHTATEPDDR